MQTENPPPTPSFLTPPPSYKNHEAHCISLRHCASALKKICPTAEFRLNQPTPPLDKFDTNFSHRMAIFAANYTQRVRSSHISKPISQAQNALHCRPQAPSHSLKS